MFEFLVISVMIEKGKSEKAVKEGRIIYKQYNNFTI